VTTPTPWTPDSWTSRLEAHQVRYPDRAGVERAVAKLASLPPLVTSWEIERLKVLLAEAEEGRRFLLQGGDCAETLADCRPGVITNKLKILLQMSLVMVHGAKRPIIRVGRFAGQYAKPRSSDTETQDGVTLPSYFGDLVNSAAFEAGARQPDPHLMVRGYQHAAMTLNFIRALVEGGFADLHHPEYWDLGWASAASLPTDQRAEYAHMIANLTDGLRFMEALGERSVDDLTRVEFYTSHEGLNLLYESAQTRTVPRRPGHYCLTTHLPWIGDRTRSIDGAHVEFFRGIRNPVGVKVGAKADPAEIVELVRTLNPDNERAKCILISRMGVAGVRTALPPLIEAVHGAGLHVLWVCDPMHANTISTKSGRKTRPFDAIIEELGAAFDAHEQLGTRLGGVHFELTGDNVTECTGGAAGLTEAELETNYASPCDPRLNYQQSLEMAFFIAKKLGATPPPAPDA
jgi:3-deoxy-7-phosphoheptulonate synthase